jgi:hypothetical protein
MHQLKPDRLTRRSDNILRLTAETPRRLAAGGHLENGVSKIVGRFLPDHLSVRRMDDCYLAPHQSGARFSVFLTSWQRYFNRPGGLGWMMRAGASKSCSLKRCMMAR